jgi:hypothetical protein
MYFEVEKSVGVKCTGNLSIKNKEEAKAILEILKGIKSCLAK